MGLALGTCNAVTKKKTERAEPWWLCSIVLMGWGRFSSSRAFQPLHLTISDVVAAAIAAAAAAFVAAAAAVAAGVVVVAATAAVFVAAAGVVVVVVAEGAAVLLAVVVASAVVVVVADAGVGVKGGQWGGNRMKDGRRSWFIS